MTSFFQKAVEFRPEDGRTLKRLGQALFYEWRDNEAEKAYRAAICLEPDNARAHYLLGDVFFHRGQIEQAIPFYRRAVALQPRHNTLGSAYDELRL